MSKKIALKAISAILRHIETVDKKMNELEDMILELEKEIKQ